MVPVLEAVPNFSEGRDPAFVDAVVDAACRHGVEVLDRSSDPDHHRSVVTWVGDPLAVEKAAVAAAEVARDAIDLAGHRGVHPRIGALDVLPFVPLLDTAMEVAVEAAHRAGRRIADELGVPVYFYGQASRPPGRGLAGIRRGGFEALLGSFPDDRRPDLDAGRSGAHPRAGATCVGARPLLLAWNVWVDGVSLDDLRGLARRLRESGGGFRGLRVLALELERAGALQLSMNLEDVERNAPLPVYEAIEAFVASREGRIRGTEVIGMIPSALVLDAGARRLKLFDVDPTRHLPERLARHLAARLNRDLQTVLAHVKAQGEAAPPPVRGALRRLAARIPTQASSGDEG